MAIGDTVKRATIAAAKANGIEPAALLAVVEIESAGKLFEQDGVTPRLLFERHVFHRELKKRAPGKLERAIAQGLAIPQWNKATQYRDQATSTARLALLDRARAVDAECANRSASWGLGQTMGFNAEGLGFPSATALLKFMIAGGVTAQVDCMVREIKRNKLEQKLRVGDWAGFARGYNGPGYAQNQYDTRLALAYRKWQAALDPNDPETGDEPVTLVSSRAAEPAPMTQSNIGNGAIATGGLGVAGTAATVWDKVSEAPDGFWNGLTAVAGKPVFWIVLAMVVVAGFIWWKRYRLKQDAGV